MRSGPTGDLISTYTHVKVKVKVTLEQATKAQRPFHDLDARWGWVVNVTSQPLYPPGKDPVPIV